MHPNCLSRFGRLPHLDAGKRIIILSSHMSDADSKLLKGSRLYQEFLAEREEIMRHKWYESEKAGHDVGFEKALLDWLVRHRATWRQKRQEQLRQQNTAVS